MPWYVIAVFALLTVVALYHSVQALRNLAQPASSLSQVTALGIFAGRNHFTEKGWRYRRLAILYQGLAFVAAIMLWAVSGELTR